jgi:hypothetical protein
LLALLPPRTLVLAQYVLTPASAHGNASLFANNANPFQQLCINNMNMIANTQFACPAGDQACFCSQSNWAYGVRDCSRQACDADQAAQAISYAQGQCQGTHFLSPMLSNPY